MAEEAEVNCEVRTDSNTNAHKRREFKIWIKNAHNYIYNYI